MTSNSTNTTLCEANDKLCIAREYQLEVIVVPALLLVGTVVTLLPVLILRYCHKKERVAAPLRYHTSTSRHTDRHTHRSTHRHTHRPNLQGIDAPPGINPLEHEEVPMQVQRSHQNTKPTPHAAAQVSTERQHGAFGQITELPLLYSIKPNDKVNLYRGRKDGKNVILRVLKDTANNSEKEHFQGFASFLSELGQHPFIPLLLGVVSVNSPLIMVVEEMEHRDLLGFLWKCRQDTSTCDMTEKRIYSMAGQVASALEYLHSKSYVHGNVGARSVLVGEDFTAKLWGLGSAYRRRTQAGSPGAVEDMELRKWQAPEVLAGRPVGQTSDIWSFGILLYEMVTLGDPPFPSIMATELLQYLQRGKFFKRPATCSNSLYSIIKACCQWNPHKRLPIPQLVKVLQTEEKSANGNTVLRVPEPMNFEKYLREAGYGEAFNYAVL